jgi:hypothetical protein
LRELGLDRRALSCALGDDLLLLRLRALQTHRLAADLLRETSSRPEQ